MTRFLSTIISALALVTATAATASAATPVRHYEGTVVSVDRDARTFRLRDSERGTIRIRVTRTTRFERIGGFAGLRRGLTNVEATVRRSGDRWVASAVERSGGGGEHGAARGSDD